MNHFATIGILVVTSAVITSCRKGEEDPFLSLASRKSRISGEWTMSEYHRLLSSFYDGDTSSYFQIDGNEEQLIRTDDFSWYYQVWDTSEIVEYSIHIQRDGTW